MLLALPRHAPFLNKRMVTRPLLFSSCTSTVPPPAQSNLPLSLVLSAMEPLPPITALLREGPRAHVRRPTEKYQQYYPAEELVEAFRRMANNPHALEQRRSAGLYALESFASRSRLRSSLDRIIVAAILGSPFRRLRLTEILEAMATRYKLHLTSGDKQAVRRTLRTSALFGRQPDTNQGRGGFWFVVAEPPLRVAPRPPLSLGHVPLPCFDEFIKAETWKPAEVPAFHPGPSEDLSLRDAWGRPTIAPAT
ncbi:hypothetical protein JB92DRAFT_2972049 [Gautieria morchelliformis]|nr:hypothetical protein JB92DRAFT_2972049 [Gautieria morchelliformis]